MPSLSEIKQFNSTHTPSVNKAVGVFFGGTSGIGKETAYMFAQKFDRPTVFIVGRSEEAGSQIVADLNRLNARATFIKSDLSQMKEVLRVSEIVKNDTSKINLLFLSQGILSTAGRTETAEGIDLRMALNYYGRWLAVKELAPLVQKAYNDGDKDNARVVSVLAPGNEGPYQENDISYETSSLWPIRTGTSRNSLLRQCCDSPEFTLICPSSMPIQAMLLPESPENCPGT
ncbi:YALI0E05731p [Yarrowia lipolytica CLIB122]|uniref:YALI0E05731p n=2 Tax=Yarrowia lipolytica TaxID=4952 RepID=Q6C6W4_YARLI|nr:YALI0E05731p [Yarrowia lipolytica CLIB122]AOW05008.1 hypothetical protein YALI1_E06737g [Yarrowia lipolytica]KAB8286175.1 hypothetical protein BKA91DRAFT_132051 [Yarrowia lipolytica]KAE8171498.1 hypothetical protein BKA90DRAFT_138877 [Yarrowia lipolytica]KAJ8056576.1 hypothetical protein LXG23DRAFT_46062 [Yarrowia lipolytica]RMI98219.1 hypothetical protein BD777DRAFT_125845 [Yarrowia lipolytica]|eukprot:XP_503598.1 YALI0E05731p [Yarrowia lipolytica CLIB122]